MNSVCPNCDEIIRLPHKVRRNSIIECPTCGESLKVVRLQPPELDYDMDEYGYEYDEEDEEYYYEDD